MGELIIYIIVAILFGLVGNRNKKKQPGKPPPQPKESQPQQGTSFEEVLKELFGEQEAKEEQVPEPPPVIVEAPEEKPPRSYYERRTYDEDAAERSAREKEFLTMDVKNLTKKREFKLSEMKRSVARDEGDLDFDFDLEQAIIAEAILKRKYF